MNISRHWMDLGWKVKIWHIHYDFSFFSLCFDSLLTLFAQSIALWSNQLWTTMTIFEEKVPAHGAISLELVISSQRPPLDGVQIYTFRLQPWTNPLSTSLSLQTPVAFPTCRTSSHCRRNRNAHSKSTVGRNIPTSRRVLANYCWGCLRCAPCRRRYAREHGAELIAFN